MSGLPPILLPPEPEEAVAALKSALGAPDQAGALRRVAIRFPKFSDIWARLGETAYGADQDVEAFAFFRTAFHRGVDRLRQNGWRGTGPVPWAHEPNQGVLRAIHGLMLASAALGEADEALRCRQLLLDSDPSDPLKVTQLAPAALQVRPNPRRLPD